MYLTKGLSRTFIIIVYELRLLTNNYFNYDKDRTLPKLIKSYSSENVLQIVNNYL